MSRSVHTQPPRIRAPRRVRAPYASRAAGDLSGGYRRARALKERGLVPARTATPDAEERAAPLPRVVVQRPAVGRVHPAGRADVLRALRLAGEPGTYGLRAVVLARGGTARGRLRLGTLRVPGTVVLYDQPPSPWALSGMLSERDARRLRSAGAIVAAVGGAWTRVTWPGDSLRDFMLYDVLMHEVGHHMVQQYTGKRWARVARTRDHEAFAARFARRCRDAYQRLNEVA